MDRLRLALSYLDKGPPAPYSVGLDAIALAFLAIPGVNETGEGQEADRQSNHQGRENGCHTNCPLRRLFAVPNIIRMIIKLGGESSIYRPI